MKRIFAVALLLLSLASVALADGPGDPPAGGVAKPAVGQVKV
jgi:hypothetical protein